MTRRMKGNVLLILGAFIAGCDGGASGTHMNPGTVAEGQPAAKIGLDATTDMKKTMTGPSKGSSVPVVPPAPK